MVQKQVVVGPLQCNCIILGCEDTGEAVVIDPGDEAERIYQHIGDLKVKYILHTHAHFDHIGGTRALRAKVPAPTCLHKADEIFCEKFAEQAHFFGIQLGEGPKMEKWIQNEEILKFGKHSLQVIHTPGHSPGSVCFKLLSGQECVYSGDTLFQQSIGRTDFWGGSYSDIIRSIKERILVFEDEIEVYPGHGPSTTIGSERRTNPFVR